MSSTEMGMLKAWAIDKFQLLRQRSFIMGTKDCPIQFCRWMTHGGQPLTLDRARRFALDLEALAQAAGNFSKLQHGTCLVLLAATASQPSSPDCIPQPSPSPLHPAKRGVTPCQSSLYWYSVVGEHGLMRMHTLHGEADHGGSTHTDWGLGCWLRGGDLLEHRKALSDHAAPSTGRMTLFRGLGRRSGPWAPALCWAWTANGGCLLWHLQRRFICLNLLRWWLDCCLTCFAHQQSRQWTWAPSWAKRHKACPSTLPCTGDKTMLFEALFSEV